MAGGGGRGGRGEKGEKEGVGGSDKLGGGGGGAAGRVLNTTRVRVVWENHGFNEIMGGANFDGEGWEGHAR
ncbi:hypothetical protein VW29_18030, partial [Devosia limi DSM 17137]